MNKDHIFLDGKSFPIQPQHINADQHFFGAFDNTETEVSAGWIVRFMQKRGEGWKPFTFEDINGHYASGGFSEGFRFNRLVEPGRKVLNGAAVFGGAAPVTEPAGGGWIILGDDDKYRVTTDFICRCYKSSPRFSVPENSAVSLEDGIVLR